MVVVVALFAFLAAAMKLLMLLLGFDDLALMLAIAGVEAFWMVVLALMRSRGRSGRDFLTIVGGSVAFGVVLTLISVGLARVWSPSGDVWSDSEGVVLVGGLAIVSFVGLLTSTALWPKALAATGPE